MKFITHINQALICFALLFAIAETANAATPKGDQLIALVDGTVVPLVQSYITATNNIAFDVVIIEDASLRKKLLAKYIKLGKWLKFEPKDAVTFKVGKGGGVYYDKATGEAVDVNTFDVISREKNQCVVRWGRILSSVCGFTKIVTLNFTDNKWVVVGVKLETVS
jgi:hypothetical protein